VLDSLALVSKLSEEESEDLDGVVYVLTSQNGTQRDHHFAPSGCGEHTTSESDQTRPIPEVLAEHPGVGGHCYFAGSNEWFGECGESLKRQDISKFGLWARGSGSSAVSYLKDISHDRNHPDLRTINYWGGTIKTSNFDYPWDDLYCHGNGWLQLARDKVSNFTSWSSTARTMCSELLNEFPASDRTMREMFDRSGAEGDTANFPGNDAILDGSYVPTRENMRRHAAWKCALDPDGVACDMAYCAVNFCTLDGGYIGHTTECD